MAVALSAAADTQLLWKDLCFRELGSPVQFHALCSSGVPGLSGVAAAADATASTGNGKTHWKNEYVQRVHAARTAAAASQREREDAERRLAELRARRWERFNGAPPR